MNRVVNGILVVDKPSGITSREAVNRIAAFFPKRTKIGHTGTLDPLATGVLVVCLGSATRLAEYVQDMDKTYRTRLVLGARSDTDDADGTISPSEGAAVIDQQEIKIAIGNFIGLVQQTPPSYSAVKIAGRRAHSLARRGERVDVSSRQVSIDAIELIDYRWPELELEIRCGKGTYIRSFARDLGEKLGCGAYVKTLRRTRVGAFTPEGSVSLDDSATAIWEKILPPQAAVTGLPIVQTDDAAIEELSHGRCAEVKEVIATTPGTDAAIVDKEGMLVGIGRVETSRMIRPLKNLGIK